MTDTRGYFLMNVCYFILSIPNSLYWGY